MDITHITSLLGGVALFLYGMSIMGAGLEKLAGGKMQGVLQKLTSSTIKGVIFGTLITGVIQSSSAMTVMLVGFVNAGMVNLTQAIGVVFGDIGTSPLYAMREALHHSRSGGTAELAVLGVVSLVFWALILVVTLKYVVFLMRADNKGEGGTLALMALAQRSLPKRSTWVFFLGVIGAALFYGDGIITPAISVLSAVEGLKEAPGVGAGKKPPVFLQAGDTMRLGIDGLGEQACRVVAYGED